MSLNMDTVVGPLLVGTWANSGLYAVELSQVAYYFTHFPKDSLMLKLFVGAVLIADTTSMIANYACVYLYSVTHWGEIPYLATQNLVRSRSVPVAVKHSRERAFSYCDTGVCGRPLVSWDHHSNPSHLSGAQQSANTRGRVPWRRGSHRCQHFSGASLGVPQDAVTVREYPEFAKAADLSGNTDGFRRSDDCSCCTDCVGTLRTMKAMLSNLNIRAATGRRGKESVASGNGVSRERGARSDIKGGHTHRPAVLTVPQKVHIDKKSATDSPHDVEIEMQVNKDYSYNSKTGGLLL
ncbi:hypothetical protein C8J57DRAFT_1242504 [Mycena rebaudengoi]|nr:hypothetical protein C8J57DRAFT_1242504 [Mycena rebaudengoi]